MVDPKFGGQGLGARLIKGLVALARSLGCYKTILDCSRENVGFYQKCGCVLRPHFSASSRSGEST